MKLQDLIARHRIIAILRSVPMEQLEDYAGAVCAGGVRMVEVALNSPGALEQIRFIRRRFGDTVTVGAGTALTVDLARQALDAGAQFLLSPSADAPVLEYCQKNGVGLLPGVMTPSDVSLCLRFGFRTLKLFPAGDLPAGYIKSLQGPFDGTQYVAVGGVGAGNIRDFLARGFLGVGIGGALIPQKAAESGNWEEAASAVAALVAAAQI